MDDKKENEKRKGETPIPDDLESLLSEHQLLALRRVEGFGWQLKFVRRPLFLAPVIIIMNNDGDSIGVLEEDGKINMEPDIKIRP